MAARTRPPGCLLTCLALHVRPFCVQSRVEEELEREAREKEQREQESKQATARPLTQSPLG
jgi:hypothetical protein